MERIFALFDSDSFYATRFMEYFKRRKEFDFGFSAFTRKDSLEEYLSVHPIEILLLGSQDLAENISQSNVKYIYQLTESPREDTDSGYHSVYKYQPARSLMNEIMNDYHKRENAIQIVNNSKQVKFISIFSPLPSAEAIAFTWSIGTMLSEQRKVLLVMLDLLPVQMFSFLDNDNASLTEYIYYLKENANSILKMKSLLGYNGNLSFLTGITHAADILSLTKEDIKKWMDEIKVQTDYHTVVFYLGVHNDAASELMESCDTVFVTGTGSTYDAAVYSVWSQQMECSGMSINNDKYSRIELPREDGLGQAPITISELRNTSSWNSAKQSMRILS